MDGRHTAPFHSNRSITECGKKAHKILTTIQYQRASEVARKQVLMWQQVGLLELQVNVFHKSFFLSLWIIKFALSFIIGWCWCLLLLALVLFTIRVECVARGLVLIHIYQMAYNTCRPTERTNTPARTYLCNSVCDILISFGVLCSARLAVFAV